MTLYLAPDATQQTYAWFAAMESDDLQQMEYLLAQGVPVDVPHPLHHTTALMEATRRGRIATVNWLLVRNAAPAFLCGSQDGPSFGTPLHCALRLHRWNILWVMLKVTPTAAVIDEQGCTPLHLLACEMGECPSLKDAAKITVQLIGKGCPLDAIDREGITALHYAIVGGHGQFAELLLQQGASPNIASPDSGVTPLAIAALERNSELATLLMKYGANPDQPMIDGKTPLTIFPALAAIATRLSQLPPLKKGRAGIRRRRQLTN
jgi:ankyrin repeat protein